MFSPICFPNFYLVQLIEHQISIIPIFCLFTFWILFPHKSFKLISKCTQKCQYNLLFQKENTLQHLKLEKLKSRIYKIGCLMSWTKYCLGKKNMNVQMRLQNDFVPIVPCVVTCIPQVMSWKNHEVMQLNDRIRRTSTLSTAKNCN